jgi:nucleoside-diphosphate-sugar epimerase
VYNIGGGSRVTVNEVLDAIARVTELRPALAIDAAQKGDMKHTFADTSLARTDLGFSPTTSLEEGLTAEFRWLRDTI